MTERAIDRIRRSFRTGMREITVPEWEGMTLYFGPVTISDMQGIEARDPKDFHEKNVLLLIHKAKDADGEPVFQMGDKHYLLTECDYAVLQRVINFMYAAALQTESEAMQVIEADPTSASASPSATSSASP